VENALFAHPDVGEVAVIGAPDEKWGEVGVAFVVRRPESELTADGVIAYCREQLARYKVPKEVIFVDELPRTAAGKVRKTELRAEYGG
jgi:fatty-acyl-CoA synthase